MKCPKCNDVFFSYVELLVMTYEVYGIEYAFTGLPQAPWCVHLNFPDNVPGVVCGTTLEEACEDAFNRCKEIEGKK